MRILPYRGAALGLAVGFSRMVDHTDRAKRKAKNKKGRHGDEPPPKKRKKTQRQRPAAAKAATATEIPGSSLNFPQAEAARRVDEGGHGQGGGAAGRDLPAGSEV